ncbi:MAG TPA: tetraacyldisaccharide 4'-kinase, partial [Pyrinomonadaceae bacterium]|nr:tetraacyldisaccharide 4'-kinase [Pyrinomonadaceae bacterium]
MNRAATVLLAPLGLIYGVAVRFRNELYRRGLIASETIGVPVISVGNLTSGGTGKTTLVAWLARELAAQGRRVCILTRGYGRQNPRSRVVASDGQTVLADVSQTGDEPWLLADKLRGKAAVICDADRVSAAKWAMTNLGSNVFVLDDAFQHQRIARQLNILTIDARNPWGNGRLLPAGILREPKRELARADCLVITRTDSDYTAALQQQLAQIHPKAPAFLSKMRMTALRELGGETTADSQEVEGSRFGAFCAIGNPASFHSLVRDAGYEVVLSRTFRDHHNYIQPDIDAIVRAARAKRVQALLTTAKDAVKLRSL